MARISIEKFLAFCRSLEGETISTRAGRSKFSVRMVGDAVTYTPLSTEKPRRRERNIESILDRFEKTGSFITTNYSDLTYNASYTLTLIDRYLKIHDA